MADSMDAVIANARERAGKPVVGFAALIAAVRRSQGAALAICSVSDGTGTEITDPWLQLACGTGAR